MINQENIVINNETYVHSYSDNNCYLLDSNNNRYIDTFDFLSNSMMEYTESEETLSDTDYSMHLVLNQLILINKQNQTDDILDGVIELGNIIGDVLNLGATDGMRII